MQNNNKTVVGSYDSRDEALDVVQKLKNEGYPKQDIILYGNDSVSNSIGDHEGVNITADAENTQDTRGNQDSDNDQSLWDQIKGAFSTDTYDNDDRSQSADYNQDDDVLYPYRDDIKNGKIVVAVDNFKGGDIDQYQSAKPVDSSISTPDRTHTDDALNRSDDKSFNDNESIQLKEEKLNVDKHEVDTGEVNIRKEVKTDTETVEVPVEKEEVVVERKSVSDTEPNASTDSINTKDETINIPVKEEQIEVSKRPVVKEEVEVKKERHQETKQVSEEVTREELDVDASGDVRVNDTNEVKNDPEHDENKKKNDATIDPLTEGREFDRSNDDIDLGI